MAGTRVQLDVEDWVRRNWMASHFEMKFSRERLPLRSGGVFDFDARSHHRSHHFDQRCQNVWGKVCRWKNPEATFGHALSNHG